MECLEINKDNTEPFQYYSPKCENSDINVSAKNVTLKSGIPQKQFHCSRKDDFEEYFEIPCTGSIPFHNTFQIEFVPDH